MSGNTSVRHMACTSCRDRKVKCDSAQPSCRRCAQCGQQCVYAPPSKQKQIDASSTIERLNDRLAQAENTLASRHDNLLAYNLGLPSYALGTNDPLWSPSGLLPITSLNQGLMAMSTLPIAAEYSVPGMANGVDFMAGHSTYPDAMAFDFPLMDPGSLSQTSNTVNIPTPSEQSINSSSRGYLNGGTEGSLDSSSGSSSMEIQTQNFRTDLSEAEFQNIFNDLYQCYFDSVHRSFPMIDKAKFLSDQDEAHVELEVHGSRYSMLAYAATLSPTYSNLSEEFYQQARKHLEQPDMEGSRGSMTIVALQANILIALYELKQNYFARAWVSVSRVIWLAQALGLHEMDKKNSPRRTSFAQFYLPAGAGPTDLEERRRTLWAAFSLKCFANIGIGWNTGATIDYREISTFLPEDPGKTADSSRLTLDDALRLTATSVLSTHQGMIVTAAICNGCLSHVKDLHREGFCDHYGYDFWVYHQRVEETIEHASMYALAHFVPNEFGNDLDVLSLYIVLQATTICMHSAVVAKVEKTLDLAIIVRIAKSESRSIGAAVEVSKMMRRVGRVNLAKMHPFIPWAIYVALQVLVWQTNKGPSQAELHSTPNNATSKHPRNFSNNLPSHNQSNEEWSQRELLDSTELLLSVLQDMKPLNPLATLLESSIQQSIANDYTKTQVSIIGLVDLVPQLSNNFKNCEK